MKILLVHNYYDSRVASGESRVIEAEASILRENANEVEFFTRHSDEILSKGVWGLMAGGLSTPWNPFAVEALKAKIKKFRPDVVQVHNTFPLLSPAIFRSIKNQAASVMTLHNYRIFCPVGIPMRSGLVCTECLDQRSAWPSLKHGCYRNSRLATIPPAFSVELHRRLKTWTRHVNAFIALSDFQKEKMVDAGLPAEKVYVKPNFFPDNPAPIAWIDRGNYAVFVGRLGSEKGVESLLRAWTQWGKAAPELRVVGDGPLLATLKNSAMGLPVEFLGQLRPEEAREQIAKAKLLILPSEWFEGFPMVIAEAFAFGTPAAVSDIGSLSSIVNAGENGIVFKPKNPTSLLGETRKHWEEPGMLEKLGRGARLSFEEKYTKAANYNGLIEIYKRAIERNRQEMKRL